MLQIPTMMQHKGNNVVLTRTDRVKRDDATKAPCRSTTYSGKTEATASLSLPTASIQGTEDTNKPIAAYADEVSKLLIRMVAKQHKGNNVALTRTDRVKRGDATKAPCLFTTYSGKTKATASLSLPTASIQGTEDTSKPIAAYADEVSKLLIRKVAKEIFDSLKKNGSLRGDDDASKPSEDASYTTSSSSESDVDAVAFSDMILNSFEAKLVGSSNSNFRKMLREGRQECESTTRASPVRSSGDSKTNSNRSGPTEAGLSGLSMQHQKGYAPPMDIWHPDFWNGEAGESCANAHSDVSAGMGDGLARPMHPAVGDFLKGAKEVSDERSDEDDDSVLSDISGLTGVFSDFPEGRRPDKQTQSSSIKMKHELGTVPNSIVATKSKPKSKNPIVSYSLRFDKVMVRNYEQILSDNPACATGPSIGLGWEFVEQDNDIEDWEMERGRLRCSSELRMKRDQREKLLRDLGYTERNIAAAVRAGHKIRCQRRQTVNNLKVSKIEEAVETARRIVKIMLCLGRKDITY
jgi:hypothetical protein